MIGFAARPTQLMVSNRLFAGPIEVLELETFQFHGWHAT
jgi:hypothetical protein